MISARNFLSFLTALMMSGTAFAGACDKPSFKPIEICERTADTIETSYNQFRAIAVAAAPPSNVLSFASIPKAGGVSEIPNLQKSGDDLKAIDIRLYPNEKYQEIYGFGASITESCLANLDKLSPAKRKEFMTKVFDPKQGAGFSYLRVPIGSNDYSAGDFSLNDTPGNQPDPKLKYFKADRLKKLVDFVKEAKTYNPKIQVMASPWTPPAWMKNTKSLKGGQLEEKNFQAYADYLKKSLDVFKQEGVAVRHLTIMNEPVIRNAKESWGFPQAFMEPKDQSNFIQNFMAPALRADKKAKTKLLLHDHNYDDIGPLDHFVADPKTRSVVDGVAYHCYSGDYNALKKSMSRQPSGLSSFQSECSSTLGDQVTDNFQFWLRNQAVDAVRDGTSGALGWNLCLDEKGGPMNNGCTHCRGMVTINQNGGDPKLEFNSEFQGVAQVSRYVQPGARRIGSSDTSADGIVNVAFENPDGTHALVVRNATDKPKNFQVRLDDCRVEIRTVPPRGAISLQWSK